MPFFVAVYPEVRPELLDQALATMRGDFATSYQRHPGRRSSRVFLQLDRPTSLVAVAEWDSERDFEKLRQSPGYQQVTVKADPPARIEPLTRLRSFVRMSQQSTYVGCATFASPPEHASTFESLVVQDLRKDTEAAPGLVSHEVFRIGATPGRLMVIHSWQSFEALERFQNVDRPPRHDDVLRALGVAAERFTGTIAVQYSRQDAAAAQPATP